MLDLRRPPNRPLDGGRRRFEWSLGACATLVEAVHARGSDVHVQVLATEPAQLDIRDQTHMAELMTLLSEVSLSMHHTFADDQARRLNPV